MFTLCVDCIAFVIFTKHLLFTKSYSVLVGALAPDKLRLWRASLLIRVFFRSTIDVKSVKYELYIPRVSSFVCWLWYECEMAMLSACLMAMALTSLVVSSSPAAAAATSDSGRYDDDVGNSTSVFVERVSEQGNVRPSIRLFTR